VVEEGEQLDGSSLSIKGWTPQAQLLLHELEDPDLGEAVVAAGGGGEPLGSKGWPALRGRGIPTPGYGGVATATPLGQRGQDGSDREEALPCDAKVRPSGLAWKRSHPMMQR
jgi:hypothetical protein